MVPLLWVPDSAAVAWPMTEVSFPNVQQKCFAFGRGVRDISVRIFPVTDLNSLEAHVVEWGGGDQHTNSPTIFGIQYHSCCPPIP